MTARDPAAILDDIDLLLTALRETLAKPLRNRRTRHDPLLACGPLVLDVACMRVVHDGAAVPLTPRELLLLRYFLERPGQVIPRERLLGDVWNYGYTGDTRTVDVHVCRLRRKLPILRTCLRALKHVGYTLTLPGALPDPEGRIARIAKS